MFTEQQIKTMSKMQDSFNTSLNPNWKEENANYYLAAAVETVEAIEHYGYAWWKDFNSDTDQVRMELIDIWHFMLSEEIRSGVNLFEKLCFDLNTKNFNERTSLEVLTTNLSNFASRNTSWVNDFYWACNKFNLTADDLFKQYVGKNILNFFRQDHGYKEGTYSKIWHGREDNEHLVEIMDACNMNDSDVDEKIYQNLQIRYQQNIK